MRTLATLTTANINLSGFLERSIAPMTILAMHKLLQERLQKLDAPEKSTKKTRQLDFLFQVEAFRLVN
jgi:hypothetical protein